MSFCCEVFEMEPLMALVQEYERLEVERQRLIQEIIELEVEASRTYTEE